MPADVDHETRSQGPPRDIQEIMALLVGWAPSADNTQHLVERRYVFGDAQLPSKQQWLRSASADETSAYFLGMPPTKDMCEVTAELLHRAQSCDELHMSRSTTAVLHEDDDEGGDGAAVIPANMWQRRNSFDLTSSPTTEAPRQLASADSAVESFPPVFSVAEYDVVQFVLKRCQETAVQCGRSLYQATHSKAVRRAGAEKRAAAAATLPSGCEEEGLVVPEELLGV